MGSTAVPRILIVDDDVVVRRLLGVIAGRCGIDADGTASGIECLDLLSRNAYDVIIVDLSMSSMSSSELFDYLRRQPICPAVIVLTALTPWSLAAVDPTVVQCILRKPFDLHLVSSVISSTAVMMRERRAPRIAPVTTGDEKRQTL